jgi:hypothetical protein
MGETGDRCAILMPSWPTLSPLFLFDSPELWSVVRTESDKITSKLHSSTENGQGAAEARLRLVRECWKPLLVVSSSALCYRLPMLFLHPLPDQSG